jgi:ATP-dependent Clp protease ATP-binding subunit ClpB
MDDIARKIMQLEIEETALKKESDKLSASSLIRYRQSLPTLRDTFNGMKAKLANEKANIARVLKLREEIEKTNA